MDICGRQVYECTCCSVLRRVHTFENKRRHESMKGKKTFFCQKKLWLLRNFKISRIRHLIASIDIMMWTTTQSKLLLMLLYCWQLPSLFKKMRPIASGMVPHFIKELHPYGNLGGSAYLVESIQWVCGPTLMCPMYDKSGGIEYVKGAINAKRPAFYVRELDKKMHPLMNCSSTPDQYLIRFKTTLKVFVLI